MMMKAIFKNLADTLGIDTHKVLFGFFETNACSVLKKKYNQSDPVLKALVEKEDERYHYGDTEITERATECVLKSFTLDRIAFIKKSGTFNNDHLLADLGDSNGIFLKSCGREGLSVNISDPAVLSLKMRGMQTVKAHIEHLPFKENSIHTILLFETLEHVPNPISLLNEIGRVCSHDLILSIPHVEKTKIHRYNYDPGRPIYQHHIFEFDRNDFGSVISHTPFVIRDEETVSVLDEKRTLIDRFVFYFWNHAVEKDVFCGCFKKFYICKLSKKAESNSRTENKKPRNAGGI